MIQKALDYLMTDPLSYVDMLLPLKRGTAVVLYAADDGVLLYETAGGVHLMSAHDRWAAKRMLDVLPQSELFTAHEEFYIADVQMKYGLKPMITCTQAAYFKDDDICCDTRCEIQEITAGDAEFVNSRYSMPIGLEYIQDRIAKREMFGAFDGDTMLGFIGVHAEGSLGMLEVFDEYRVRGVASALLAFMANHVRSKGLIPFSQLKTGNIASYRLHQKLGFELSDRDVFWLER